MTRIADLELLLRAAELGSLTAAARALDCSPAAASAAVKRQEAEWGVPLFVRSTRSLRPSAEGERLLPHLRQALHALQQGRAAVQAQHRALRGELQLALPSDLGRHVLLPWLEAFQQRHPQLALRLHLSDRNSDLVRTPMDVAIRYGAPDAATQVALPLAPDNRRVLVAAPGWLARHGSPATPEALGRCEALRFMLGGEVPPAWPLCIEGRWLQVPVQGRRSANDGEVVRRWALAGLGIAYKSRLDVAADLAAGRLVQVNPHWRGEPSPLALVVPARRQLTPAVRQLRDWLRERLDAIGPDGAEQAPGVH